MNLYRANTPILGTGRIDTSIVNHVAAAVVETSKFSWQYMATMNYFWSGEVLAGHGENLITLDRPGAYRDFVGNAYISGGNGNDTISYAHAADQMNIDLDTGDSRGTASAAFLHGVTIHSDDWLYSFENVIGSHSSDRIEGTNAVNRLSGFRGRDTVYGLGDDGILRGDGDYKLYGGSGGDSVRATTGPTSSTAAALMTSSTAPCPTTAARAAATFEHRPPAPPPAQVPHTRKEETHDPRPDPPHGDELPQRARHSR